MPWPIRIRFCSLKLVVEELSVRGVSDFLYFLPDGMFEVCLSVTVLVVAIVPLLAGLEGFEQNLHDPLQREIDGGVGTALRPARAAAQCLQRRCRASLSPQDTPARCLCRSRESRALASIRK